nr:ribonuclease H-like domain-containing protein [Tanacetum cinerariifolium]
DYQVTRSEFEGLLQQERQTEHIKCNNSFNTISSPINTAGPSFVNAASPSLINTAGPHTSTNAFEEHPFKRFSPFKNAFSLPHVPIVTPINDTGIFDNAYDDEAVEEEVAMTNVVSSYIIHDAPITKFLKDYPKDQVIGSIETPVQTRQMTKINKEHGLISSVQKLRRTNHKDFQNYKWAIGTKWVFRNKKDERGLVIKNKARLVAQGHTQEEGIDYDEVFAPVARIEDIRLFLAYAFLNDFVVYQMDVKSAFLYGKIEEEVYVCQPTGFEDPDFPGKVYKVEKALYGLHQAPRACIFKDAKVEDVDVHLYRLMIGSLMYLTASRYLKVQPKFGLWYPRDSPFNLESYSDSDYAGASLDKKSTTREYVVAASCCGQGLWIQN